MTSDTETRLREIRERVEKATPPPWKNEGDGVGHELGKEPWHEVVVGVTGSRRASVEKGRADLTARLKKVDQRQLELFLDQLQATKAKKTFGQFAEEWRANVSRVWWEKESPRFEHLRPLFDFTELELTPKRVKDHLTALRPGERVAGPPKPRARRDEDGRRPAGVYPR